MERLSGAPNDIINPNGLAFVVLTALPFIHYVLGGSKQSLVRLIYAALFTALLYALVLTGSRSGLIGLLVLTGAIILQSNHRMALLAIAGIVGVVLVGLMSNDLKDRYLSIADNATKNAATVVGRKQHLLDEIRVWSRRPLIGHGLGTSSEALSNQANRYQPSHNLYTEILVELGVFGLAIYLLFLASIFRNISAARSTVAALKGKVDREAVVRLAFYERCVTATLVFVVTCLVFSIASYGLSELYWYMIAGLTVAMRSLINAERGPVVPVSGRRSRKTIPKAAIQRRGIARPNLRPLSPNAPGLSRESERSKSQQCVSKPCHLHRDYERKPLLRSDPSRRVSGTFRRESSRPASVPISRTVPALIPSGRSVTSRSTNTGFPRDGASSWMPPESVRMM